MGPDPGLPRGRPGAPGRTARPTTDETDAPIHWLGADGAACESTRHAERAAAPIVLRRFLAPSDTRLWRVLALLRRAVPEDAIHGATGINPWFLAEFGRAVALERAVQAAGPRLADPTPDGAASLLVTAKRAGFGDRELADLAGIDRATLRASRLGMGLRPGYAMVDTCAAEFAAETPYFYATYAAAGSPPEAPPVTRPAALVIGSGPVRIGQGIEFDYCAVHAAAALRRLGWSAVMINSNPETVSTDFDASTRLYFEPLDPESVMSVIEAETPAGEPPLPAFVQFGGQTPLNLAASLAAAGVELLGADLEAIDQSEERTRFAALLDRLGIPQPEGGMAHSVEEALTLADRIGYPVIVRPSFVIGGLAIDFSYSPSDLVRQLAAATVVDPDRPVRIDRYLEGVEVDVDAVSDGRDVLIPGLLEHVERAGVHSGDSVGLYPPQSVIAGRPGAHRRDDGADRPGPRGPRPGQRPVHRPRRRGLPDRGQPPRLADRALPEQGDRASRWSSWRSGSPSGRRWPGWAGRVACCPIRTSSRSRRRRSRPRSCAAWIPRSGPGCNRPARSSGSIAIHGWRWPRRSSALRSSRPARGRRVPSPCFRSPIATRPSSGGWPMGSPGPATASPRPTGTARALAALGHDARLVAKYGTEPDPGDPAPPPPILDLIAAGEVRLVVNTPTPQSGAVRDAAEIRLAATAEGILCLTAIETAVAAAEALDPAVLDRLSEVRSLAEWVPAGADRGPVAAGSAGVATIA